MTDSGAFTISLDFELMWGVYDSRSKSEYGSNILGTRAAISGMLDLFDEYGVGVTWAAVGLLFCNNKDEMIKRLDDSGLGATRPDLLEYIEREVGHDVHNDPYHFGIDLLQQIQSYGRQEISSHSFAHYGLFESYANPEGFSADMKAVGKLFDDLGLPLDSYIFARNQVDIRFLPELGLQKIKAFRGCPDHPWYSPRGPEDISHLLRLAKLVDSYLPLTALSVSKLHERQGMTDTLASRFLRPWNPALGPVNNLQINRIKREMTQSAKAGNYYHLWWHPHNFGACTDQNLHMLDQLLSHFSFLNERYAWPSKNMAELALEAGR